MAKCRRRAGARSPRVVVCELRRHRAMGGRSHECLAGGRAEANAVVAPIHPKATSVTLTTPGEFNQWLEATRSTPRHSSGRCLTMRCALRSARRVRRRTGAPSFRRDPIRIAVSARAYRAIKAALPAGSVQRRVNICCGWLRRRRTDWRRQRPRPRPGSNRRDRRRYGRSSRPE
jgi:hypothetical protein